jgi:hypothetical protein
VKAALPVVGVEQDLLALLLGHVTQIKGGV